MPETIAEHKSKLDDLLKGALTAEQSVAYLRELSTAESLNAELLALILNTVRASMPADCARFGTYIKNRQRLIDCCGTGGSGLPHYNTSTTVAFIIAAAGLQTAKFGNRAASSQAGSFDLLHRLGIGDALPLEALGQLLSETNLAFLFAPQFYPVLAGLAPYRKAAGVRTIFNYLGPLLNPANPPYRLIGVPNKQAQAMMADLLNSDERINKACIVSADSGLDEIDVLSTTTAINIDRAGQKSPGTERIAPFDGNKLVGKYDGPLSVEDNAQIFNALLLGRLSRDNYYHALVCTNAGAALHTAGAVAKRESGYKMAAALLEEGTVLAKFKQYQQKFVRLRFSGEKK